MKHENKKKISYESPSLQIVYFETESVLSASNTQGKPGGFWGEEDSFAKSSDKVF